MYIDGTEQQEQTANDEVDLGEAFGVANDEVDLGEAFGVGMSKGSAPTSEFHSLSVGAAGGAAAGADGSPGAPGSIAFGISSANSASGEMSTS